MNRDDAYRLLTADDLQIIEERCSQQRRTGFGNRVDICAIINAANGGCTEDCSFCAQSHSPGSVPLDTKKLTDAHKSATKAGVSRFSAVTSGKAGSADEMKRICEMAEMGRDLCSLCASMGILDLESLKKLKRSGVTRYHHNLETSRTFFHRVCSTHTWEERAETVANARKAGMEVCSGGIFGIGESDQDRIDLAFSLSELQVDSVALNFFIPVPGSRIQCERLSPEKMLRIIALFRLMDPRWEVRVCAGRNGFGKHERRIFNFGATGVMTGTLLTTEGSSQEYDRWIIELAGYSV